MTETQTVPVPSSFDEFLQTVLIQARQMGFNDGFQAGRIVGYIDGVNAMVPAVSDGLRHGSSECGKAMQGLKSMGALLPQNTD